MRGGHIAHGGPPSPPIPTREKTEMGSLVKVIQFAAVSSRQVPRPCKPKTIQANLCQSASNQNGTEPH